MKVEKIDHIGICVRDLEKAKRFFSDLLGTEFSQTFELGEFAFKSAMEPFGIEVVEPTSPDGFIARTIERRGEGVIVIGLKVPDIEEGIAEMKSWGLRLISRIERGQLKAAQFHPRDTFGVMIELLQYPLENPIVLAMSK